MRVCKMYFLGTFWAESLITFQQSAVMFIRICKQNKIHKNVRKNWKKKKKNELNIDHKIQFIKCWTFGRLWMRILSSCIKIRQYFKFSRPNGWVLPSSRNLDIQSVWLHLCMNFMPKSINCHIFILLMHRMNMNPLRLCLQCLVIYNIHIVLFCHRLPEIWLPFCLI